MGLRPPPQAWGSLLQHPGQLSVVMTPEFKPPGTPLRVPVSALTPAQASRSQAIPVTQGSQQESLWALRSRAVTATDPMSPNAELDVVTWCSGAVCGSRGALAPAGRVTVM